jgi:hypothetical protein
MCWFQFSVFFEQFSLGLHLENQLQLYRRAERKTCHANNEATGVSLLSENVFQ